MIRTQAVAWSVTLVLSGVALGQSDESLLISSALDEKALHLDAAALVYPASTASGTGRSALWELSSNGHLRLDNSHDLNPILGYSWFEFRPGERLGPIGGTLDDVSFAFATPVTTVGDWFIGARAGVGYAGDHAFADDDAWHGLASLSAGRKFGNGDKLLLWIDYDGNRTLFPGVPVPQFAYAGAINERTDYVIGIPESSIEYRPDPAVVLSLKYQALFTVEGEAEWKPRDQVSLFVGYVSEEHAFRSSDMEGSTRVFLDEQRAQAGVRWSPSDAVKLSVLGGYGFGRSVSTGYDDRDRSKVLGLSDGWFLSAELSLEF